MDGKNLLTAFAFLGVFATILATVATVALPHWSRQALRRLLFAASALCVLAIVWVLIAFWRTPDVPGAVKQSLEGVVEIADSAKFRGKNWNIFGALPRGFVKAGGNSETSIENLTIVQQPEEMLRITPTEQFRNDTKDELRQRAEIVANRLLYGFDPQSAAWPGLQSDAKSVFAEVLRRLPPIKTSDVYIKYRTGYEAICGLNHHQWVDKDYAKDAAIYLLILVEQLPENSK